MIKIPYLLNIALIRVFFFSG